MQTVASVLISLTVALHAGPAFSAPECGCPDEARSSSNAFTTYFQFDEDGPLEPVLVEDIGGEAVIDDHVVLGSAKEWRDFAARVESRSVTIEELKANPSLAPKGALSKRRKWPDGVVPYQLPKLTKVQKKAFDKAIADWKEQSGGRITFRPRKSADARFINVVKVANSSTCSWRLSEDKLRLGTRYPLCAAHELGHALGLAHEHKRHDRNKYVSVQWNNIRRSACSQFAQLPKSASTGGYNLSSVMHYKKTGQRCRGTFTLKEVPPHKITRVTDRITKGDIAAALKAQGLN